MSENSFRNSLYDQIYQESIGPDIKTFKNLFPNKYKLSKSFFEYETEIVLQPGPKINMVRSFIPTKINY